MNYIIVFQCMSTSWSPLSIKIALIFTKVLWYRPNNHWKLSLWTTHWYLYILVSYVTHIWHYDVCVHISMDQLCNSDIKIPCKCWNDKKILSKYNGQYRCTMFVVIDSREMQYERAHGGRMLKSYDGMRNGGHQSASSSCLHHVASTMVQQCQQKHKHQQKQQQQQ